MTDFPNAQNNPAGAIPVYMVAGGAAGAIKSLNAATVAPTTGAVLAFGAGQARVGMQVSHTGGATAVTVDMEGTINGTDWFVMATYNGGSGGSDANGAVVVSANIPVLKTRTTLRVLTGGAAPTVTAYLLAA